MARYRCPDCRIRSHNLPTRAEAAALLETHRQYFCTPRATVLRRRQRLVRRLTALANDRAVG